MRRFLYGGIVALLLGGCSSAPEPYPEPRFNVLDPRFQRLPRELRINNRTLNFVSFSEFAPVGTTTLGDIAGLESIVATGLDENYARIISSDPRPDYAISDKTRFRQDIENTAQALGINDLYSRSVHDTLVACVRIVAARLTYDDSVILGSVIALRQLADKLEGTERQLNAQEQSALGATREMDNRAADLVFRDGNAICRHYNKVTSAVFAMLKEHNPLLSNTYVVNVSHEHLPHAWNLAFQIEPDSIRATMIDSTWFDTKVRAADNRGVQTTLGSLDADINAYDPEHFNLLGFASLNERIGNTEEAVTAYLTMRELAQDERTRAEFADLAAKIFTYSKKPRAHDDLLVRLVRAEQQAVAHFSAQNDSSANYGKDYLLQIYHVNPELFFNEIIETAEQNGGHAPLFLTSTDVGRAYQRRWEQTQSLQDLAHAERQYKSIAPDGKYYLGLLREKQGRNEEATKLFFFQLYLSTRVLARDYATPELRAEAQRCFDLSSAELHKLLNIPLDKPLPSDWLERSDSW